MTQAMTSALTSALTRPPQHFPVSFAAQTCTLALHMYFLLFLARAFINTFGITQPSAQGEQRAAYFIGTLLFLIVLGMVAALAGFIFVHR